MQVGYSTQADSQKLTGLQEALQSLIGGRASGVSDARVTIQVLFMWYYPRLLFTMVRVFGVNNKGNNKELRKDLWISHSAHTLNYMGRLTWFDYCTLLDGRTSFWIVGFSPWDFCKAISIVVLHNKKWFTNIVWIPTNGWIPIKKYIILCPYIKRRRQYNFLLPIGEEIWYPCACIKRCYGLCFGVWASNVSSRQLLGCHSNWSDGMPL